MPFRLDLKRGREGSKGLLWNTRTNHGQAQERRVCVISGTSHGTLPLRWADQTLWRRAAKSCAHPAAHRAPSWRASRVLEEKSSRSILATGPRPRRKLSDDLKRLDTPTSPRRGPMTSEGLMRGREGSPNGGLIWSTGGHRMLAATDWELVGGLCTKTGGRGERATPSSHMGGSAGEQICGE